MSYVDMVQRSGAAPVVVHQRGPHPEAGRRRDHRLRPRRRLRARALRRRAVRRGGRRARPAGDPARHHPGRRRHPAAHPPGRARAAPRTSSSPAGSSRPTRRWRSGWSTASYPPTGCTTRRVAWAGQFTHAATYALRAAKEAIDLGLEVDLDTGLAIERQQFAALFATDDRADRDDVVRRERARARREFTGPLTSARTSCE